MGQQKSQIQILEKSIYPNIYVNTEKSWFQIKNGDQQIEAYDNGRIFFNCTNIQGQILDPIPLNDLFYKGCFCPQGYQIVFLHIGYSLNSKLDIQQPQSNYVDYTNKQALKLSHPYILGFIVQDLSNRQKNIYIESDYFKTKLVETIIRGDSIGLIKQDHQFPEQLWQFQLLNTKYNSQQFQNACFHTLIPYQLNKQISIENDQQIGLKTFKFKGNQNSNLIGIAYRKQTDLYPVLIYGFNHDIQVFSGQIQPISADIFYYAQKTFNTLGLQQYFLDGMIAMIAEAFQIPKVNQHISDQDYIKIQQQLSLVLQGNILIFGQNLHGKIDSIVSNICSNDIFKAQPMCFCLNQQIGTECQDSPLNVKCRLQGYKTQTILNQKCLPSTTTINVYDQSQLVSIQSAGSLNVGDIGISSKSTQQQKNNLIK